MNSQKMAKKTKVVGPPNFTYLAILTKNCPKKPKTKNDMD